MVVEVIKALVRRWYLLLLGVAVTAGLVFGARTASPPTYEARGLVLMLPSPIAVGKGGNPLLVLDGLEQPAGILVAHYASTPAHEDVAAISSDAQFTVLLDASIRGPVIAIEVTDKTPEAAMAVLKHLIDDIPKQLTSLQQQVQASSNAYIGSMTLSVDTVATENRSATVRLMIVAFVIGMVGTVVATFALDSFLQRRSGAGQRRRDRTKADPTAASATDDVPVETNRDDTQTARTDQTDTTEHPRRHRRGAARQKATSPVDADHNAPDNATSDTDDQVGAGRP